MRRFAALLVLGALLSGCSGEDGGTAPVPATSAATSSEALSGAADVQLRVVALASGTAGPTPVAAAPPRTWAARFADFACSGDEPNATPDPADYLLACRGTKDKFLLEPAAWHGAVRAAAPRIPQGQAVWAVDVTLPTDGAAALADLSRDLMQSGGQVALVVDGTVVSWAGFGGRVTDGQLEITGGFNERSAHELADRLTGSSG